MAGTLPIDWFSAKNPQMPVSNCKRQLRHHLLAPTCCAVACSSAISERAARSSASSSAAAAAVLASRSEAIVRSASFSEPTCRCAGVSPRDKLASNIHVNDSHRAQDSLDLSSKWSNSSTSCHWCGERPSSLQGLSRQKHPTRAGRVLCKGANSCRHARRATFITAKKSRRRGAGRRAQDATIRHKAYLHRYSKVLLQAPGRFVDSFCGHQNAISAICRSLPRLGIGRQLAGAWPPPYSQSLPQLRAG